MALKLGKKKQEEKQPEETETIEAEAISPEVKAKLESMVTEFNDNYNNIMVPSNFSEKALQINLMFAIFGELVKIRKLMEE